MLNIYVLHINAMVDLFPNGTYHACTAVYSNVYIL